MGVHCNKTFLKRGVFHWQQIQPVSVRKLEKKMGELSIEELQAIRIKLAEPLKVR